MKELGDSGFHGIVSQHAHTRMNDRYAILKEERETDKQSHGQGKASFFSK